jgi:hypothetical protein
MLETEERLVGGDESALEGLEYAVLMPSSHWSDERLLRLCYTLLRGASGGEGKLDRSPEGDARPRS